MKAQLSLEFLIISAAFLSFLLLWVSSANTVKEKIDEMICDKKVKYFLKEINNTINEVDALRGKNLRKIEKLGGENVFFDGKKLTFEYKEKNYSLDAPTVRVLKIKGNSTFYLIYYDGGIVIEG